MNSDFDPDTLTRIIEYLPGQKPPGLINGEVAKIQTKYDFVFPPDLSAFLQVGIPEDFHHWHKLASDDLKVDLKNPDLKDTATGMIKMYAMPDFDDTSMQELECSDRDELEKRRQEHPMVPIMGTCFMPAVPHETGLSVASMRNSCNEVDTAKNFWEFSCKGAYMRRVEKNADASLAPEAWAAKEVGTVPFWELLLLPDGGDF